MRTKYRVVTSTDCFDTKTEEMARALVLRHPRAKIFVWSNGAYQPL